MTINSNKCACTLTRQTLFRVTLRLCFVRFRTIGHSPPGLRRLFVFHRANTILVTVHSILFYLIPIKGQRCIGHLLLLFPPSRVDARFCFISNWLRSDALIFHPSLRFLSSFAKLFPLPSTCSSLESAESFLSFCSLCIYQALFAPEQTTRLPLAENAASLTCALFDYLTAILAISWKPGSNRVFGTFRNFRTEFREQRSASVVWNPN